MSAPGRRVRGLRVLVADSAAQGLRPDDHDDCVDGELCWVLPPCARSSSGCRCHEEFEGASTEGRTTTARVAVLEHGDRSEVLRTLRDAAAPLLGPVMAARAAERTLGAAAALPPGTFVVRTALGVRPQFCAHHQHQVLSWRSPDDDHDDDDGEAR